MINKPKYLFTDKGSEFISKDVQQYLKNNNIIWYSTNSEIKCSIAERFNLTLRNKLEKRKTELELQGKTFNWVNEIPKLLEDYNTKDIHSTTGLTPIESHKDENMEYIRNRFYRRLLNIKKDKQKFNIGDNVRLYKWKDTFQKKSGRRFTDEVFIISKINDTRPITYQIKDKNNEPVEGSCYSFELVKSEK